ncbi:DUF6169 family protein [Chitinophaga sp. GCM10012297]|nr:DUF6169 family protein [Chitinophaga chungangae]
MLSGDATQSGPDPRVADTIVKVFVDFIMKHEWRAVTYICDSSDSKELARKRKFDQWFSKYNRVMFAKCDCIAVFGKQQIQNAMIVRTDNRFWDVYLIVYHQLNRVIGKMDDEERAA